ncbi:MAG: bacteriohemerythrin [Xanthomonadaceae bacterium]|nr:bacteriohemerythrin [Xanthomonadaceae bacterium]
MTWTDDFSVHDLRMDDQHRMLFDYINNLCDVMDRDRARPAILDAYQKVLDYTGFHFRDEEALMERVNYPGLSKHRLVHQQLVTRALDFKERIKTGDAAAPDELKYFLKNWLTAHIKGIDVQYSAYLGPKGSH